MNKEKIYRLMKKSGKVKHMPDFSECFFRETMGGQIVEVCWDGKSALVMPVTGVVYGP